MTQSKDLDTSYRIAFPEDVARRMVLASSRARAAIVQLAAEESRRLAARLGATMAKVEVRR